MRSRRLARWLLLVGALTPAQLQGQERMTAHFIDVGQAHATLLEFPCGAALIDAGSDSEHDNSLVDYLTGFFARRADLHDTLQLVLITHNHIDHTRSLRDVAQRFSIKRYFDNGFTTGSGAPGPNWLKAEAASSGHPAVVREITQTEAATAPDQRGLTDGDIDPFDCGTVDPTVHILWGRVDSNPGWPEGDVRNQNNNSLVTRVDFGESSFLFMGDLEEEGIESLTTLYGSESNGILDADVLQVSHHGSHNGTTAELVRAVTPTVAVIPVGPWTFGRTSASPFTTFAFGHARQAAVDLLAVGIGRRRSPSKSVMVADKGRQFHEATIRRAIYATGWDGTVRVFATSQGRLTVYREH